MCWWMGRPGFRQRGGSKPHAVFSREFGRNRWSGLWIGRFGSRFVAYVDPAFQVGVASIVVEAYEGAPRMKLAAGGVLGDVNNDGLVDLVDLLFVMLYSMDPSIILPNNGDISLGDIKRRWNCWSRDAVLILHYLIDPSDPSLPPANR